MSVKSRERKKKARESRTQEQVLIDENNSLRQGMSKQNKLITELQKEIKALKNGEDVRLYKERAIKAESEVEPLKKSINQLTAERSKWIRKLKRAGVS